MAVTKSKLRWAAWIFRCPEASAAQHPWKGLLSPFARMKPHSSTDTHDRAGAPSDLGPKRALGLSSGVPGTHSHTLPTLPQNLSDSLLLSLPRKPEKPGKQRGQAGTGARTVTARRCPQPHRARLPRDPPHRAGEGAGPSPLYGRDPRAAGQRPSPRGGGRGRSRQGAPGRQCSAAGGTSGRPRLANAALPGVEGLGETPLRYLLGGLVLLSPGDDHRPPSPAAGARPLSLSRPFPPLQRPGEGVFPSRRLPGSPAPAQWFARTLLAYKRIRAVPFTAKGVRGKEGGGCAAPRRLM